MQLAKEHARGGTGGRQPSLIKVEAKSDCGDLSPCGVELGALTGKGRSLAQHDF